MKLSVVICTWNRSERLHGTLESIAGLRNQVDFDWELIVVENNCTDDTKIVLESFKNQLPLRVISEKAQGHAVCRNRAIAECNGQFIVWTDDDVIVSRNWLTAYVEAINKCPEASFFGGPIEPDYPNKLPRWHRENLDICDAVHAKRHLGDESRRLDARSLPFGANFVTRRAVQREFRFNSQFGRVANQLRGYDEIDVLTRMVESGHVGYWVPESLVHHVIAPSRISMKYIREYFFGQGQTWVTRGISQSDVESVKRDIRRHQLGMFLGYFSRSTRPRFRRFVALANLQGQLDQLNRIQGLQNFGS